MLVPRADKIETSSKICLPYNSVTQYFRQAKVKSTCDQHLRDLNMHQRDKHEAFELNISQGTIQFPHAHILGGESFALILSFCASLISRCRQLGFPSVLSWSWVLFTSSPPIPGSGPYLQLEISKVLVDPPSSSNFSKRQRDTTVFTYLPR